MLIRSSRWTVIALLLISVAVSQPVAEGEPEVRAFWADAFASGLKTRAEIDLLVDRVLQANANTIVAQVRRRGDSFYLNSAEPFTDDTAVEPGLDPLAYLLERAHANGLEVHAWIIANALYSGHPYIATGTWPCKVPCSPQHAFNQHGFFATGDDNWLTRTHPSYTAGTSRYVSGGVELIPFGWRLTDGNWWIDPGHPAAAEYTVDVIKHLVTYYDIDGLHLDRIRYPEMPISRPFPGGPIGFSTGYNAVSVRRFNSTYGRPASDLPLPWDASWSQWRRDQMDALMRRIYLETIAIKPNVKVSAATITFWRGPGALGGFQNTEAYYRAFQDWDGWMRQGFLDLNMPMAYKPVPSAENAAQYTDWVNFTRTHQYARQAAIGIGVYLNVFEDSIAQLEESRLPAATGDRAVGQVLYSYATTNKVTAGIPHRPHAEYFRALSEDGAYVQDAPYSTPASIPLMPWKAQPRHGYLLAQIVGTDGLPADGAEAAIRMVGSGAAAVFIPQVADGNGYIGAADLPPGAYQLVVRTPDGTEFHTVPEPVAPGRVSRVVVRLASKPRGPMIRAGRTAPALLLRDDEVSPLEDWRGREPVAEDLIKQPDGSIEFQ